MAFSRYVALALLLSSVVAAGHLEASGPKPRTVDLVLVRIVDADSHEYVFVVGETGFRSVAALKRYVESLPKHSILRWAPGCSRFGDEPLLSSDAAMDDFRDHCSKVGVKLVVVPSG